MEYIIEENRNGNFILKVKTGIFGYSRIGWGYGGAFFPNEYSSIEEAELAADEFAKRECKSKIVKTGRIDT